MVPGWTRQRLADLLDTAQVDPECVRLLRFIIYDPSLQWWEVDGIRQGLKEMQPHCRDVYAPGQLELSKWIRSFANITGREATK